MKHDIENINSRLSSLFRHAFDNLNERENKDGCKIADIIQAVRVGRSSPARLATADKLLSNWGF